MTDLLTLKQAAKILYTSERTLRRRIANRELKVVRVARKPLIRPEELERYVKTRERLA